ncbi:hypothetical protein ZIOFF_025032 [Zingiber officinale]|uniref:Uncharacterized protein n=1 Tax=Zingiber officinale TaxID=94328 RepID=A0A8J5H064_ZINOF|nr:hypothetical protein ZIOFF_025032 [Zingiber officinale]
MAPSSHLQCPVGRLAAAIAPCRSCLLRQSVTRATKRARERILRFVDRRRIHGALKAVNFVLSFQQFGVSIAFAAGCPGSVVLLMVVVLYHLGIIGARNTAFGETGKIKPTAQVTSVMPDPQLCFRLKEGISSTLVVMNIWPVWLLESWSTDLHARPKGLGLANLAQPLPIAEP